jgi:hypothetical protein
MNAADIAYWKARDEDITAEKAASSAYDMAQMHLCSCGRGLTVETLNDATGMYYQNCQTCWIDNANHQFRLLASAPYRANIGRVA